MMQAIHNFKAELLLLAVAIIWGTSYGLTKEALLYISVPAFLALRFLLTFLLLSPALLADYQRGLAQDLPAACFTGSILFSIFLAEVYGVAHTSAANAAFLISLCVIITPLLEWAILCWQQPSLAISLPNERHFWLVMLYLVLFCSIFAFFAMNYGLRHTTPTRVALLTGSEPAWGALFAVLYLGEHLVWYQWLGGLLMVAASLYTALPEKLTTKQLT